MHFDLHMTRAIGLAACLALMSIAPSSRAQTAGARPVIPDNATALEGQPTVRIDATKESATRRTLDGAEAARESLKISVMGGHYYWTSRDNRPLTLSSSGEFTYLSSTDPGRYVRLRRVNDKIAYVEHVDTASGSVTYWGELRIVLGKQARP